MNLRQEAHLVGAYCKAVASRVAFWVFTIAAGVAWILSLIGVAIAGWVGLVLVLVGLFVAQYGAYRELRVQAELPVPVTMERLPDLTMGDTMFFRASVRNVGDRRGAFRARVAAHEGLIAGPEAPFELNWRHGNNRWAVEIAPDDDEVWIEIGQMKIYPAAVLRTIERERWTAGVFFQILVKEDEEPQLMGAAIAGVDTVDDLTSCHPSARFTIRHVASGKIVANKRVVYGYAEKDGFFVPHIAIENV